MSNGDSGSLTTAKQEKADRIQNMFNRIHKRYDFLNRLLSLGIDSLWRRDAVKATLVKEPNRILDVATGTADLAISLKRARPSAEVIGVDFAESMLEIGREKVTKAKLELPLLQGDGLALHYPDNSFSAITIAYGLRNFADVEAGLREFYRVLEPGGRLVVLEFPPPPTNLIGKGIRFYYFNILPKLGGFLSGDPDAYSYLPASVIEFPNPEQLAQDMREAGFFKVDYKVQSLGISALHVADKAVATN